jgi:Tfp pilus assembly protein PilF
MGICYMQAGNLPKDEALIHLEKACDIDPKDKSAYSQLAVSYRRKGKTELAGAMLRILNKLNEEARMQNKRQRLRILEEEASATGAEPER